jgi:uncharacterized protein DUF3800
MTPEHGWATSIFVYKTNIRLVTFSNKPRERVGDFSLSLETVGPHCREDSAVNQDFSERSTIDAVAGRAVIFMFVYTAYLDESGTHDGLPITVMGGVLARAEQWRDFEKKFAAVQSQYGFRVWHTKKFKKKAGDFRGWTDEKCHDLYWSMRDVTAFGLTDVVALTLDNASYEADYKAGDLPRKARLDTKYGLCFRFCLVHFVQEVLKRKRRNRIPPLHIVLEAGHANFGDAERIFQEESVYANKQAFRSCARLPRLTKTSPASS